METLYEILGVPRNATDEAIRTAFRRAAKACHPDLNAGDRTAEQQLTRIIGAYQALKTPQQRAAYNEYLATREHHWSGIGRRKIQRFAQPAVAALLSGGFVALAVWMSLSLSTANHLELPVLPISKLEPPRASADAAALWDLRSSDASELRTCGQLGRALGDYEAAISLDPNNPSLFRDRGILWHRHGELDRALVDLDHAVRLGFSDACAYNERGLVWYEKQRYDRAIADFNQALRINPNFAGALVNRGNAFRSKGDFDRAVADFDQADRIDASLLAGHQNGAGAKPSE